MADGKKQPPKAGTVELDERDLDSVQGGAVVRKDTPTGPVKTNLYQIVPKPFPDAS